MAATPYPLTPARGWLADSWAWLSDELAPRPHRLRSTMRSAAIGAIGAGLMAAAHIASGLGPYLIWLLAGTPTAMMSWRRAAIFVAVLGAAIASSFLLAQVLVQSPILLLLTLGGFTGLTTYYASRYQLGSLGLIIEVLVLDNFYQASLAPADAGWAAGATFGAVAAGIVLIALVDNWFWPDPAEAILTASLAANLRRIRRNLLDSTHHYLNERRAAHVSRSPAGDTVTQLALLARAQAEGISPHRHAVLLGALTRVSRIESEANQLMILANERGCAPAARDRLRTELTAAVAAIAAALQELATDAATLLRTGPDDPPSPAAERVAPMLAAMDAQIEATRPGFINHVNAVELANLSSYFSGIRALASLLERPLDEPIAAAHAPVDHATAQAADTSLKLYSCKVAITVVIGYIIGLTSHRADLSTILTTVIIAGLPTYGASHRKMILRIVGAILGGVVTVAAIIIVSPNFETLPSYFLAIFVVLVVSGYAGQSSEKFAYAGKQIGTTFMLVFAGLSPSLAIETPLWRLWGVLLGTGITAVVFMLLWPVYATDSLLPRMRKALAHTLALDPGAALSEPQIRQLDTALTQLFEQLIAVAEDARMEGRSAINADSVVSAAGTLRRIAHRFERITLTRDSQPRPALDTATEAAQVAVFDGITAQLKLWLSYFEHCDRKNLTDHTTPTPAANKVATQLEEFSRQLEANGFAQIADWPLKARRTVLTELQSLRRLAVLLDQLDHYLAGIVIKR